MHVLSKTEMGTLLAAQHLTLREEWEQRAALEDQGIVGQGLDDMK